MTVHLENPDWGMVLPQLIVLVAAIVVSLLDAFLPKERHFTVITGVTLAGFGAAIVAQLSQRGETGTTFHGLFQLDGLTVFLNLVILVAAVLTVLISASYVEYLDSKMGTGEFYTLLTFAVFGAMLTASAGDMVMLYVGIELTSIATYILTAFAKRRTTALEGAFKYFLLGLFASAILLYGMSWIYGSTGSTGLNEISASLTAALTGSEPNAGMILGMLLVIVGFSFKLAAVPFHFWTPDAYDGAPTPVTGYMSVIPKAAAAVAMIRILVQGLESLADDWTMVLAVLAFVTMLFGNIVAISQTDVKRMLAYSSIAHTGYMIAGIAAFRLIDGMAGERSISSVLYYLIAYTFMNIGAFAIVVWVQHRGDGTTLGDFAGLASRSPLAALAMTVFLVSLMGIPPTIGFYAKYYVIVALLESNLLWLAMTIVMASAISAYFYLRVVAVMYFQEKSEDTTGRPIVASPLLNLGIGVMVVGVLALGLFSSPIINLANDWTNLFSVAALAMGR
ncbi:MAG: NADH-quinone oxidoreductase subunit N [Thermomicrobiales bacterium]|nr:NADH-quinone oxidoreductase subunit N [Thermomicrobiales bacterium]MCO5219662.1 NADH-quinone oxidoreductase subunit N [Thermomicrobiales bacterium]MCO5226196.1 NADH-quinone oxidoreductase subunit N [Thermomicrobiales bacterium]MCO5228366.1 NADH-quinone oxidoreductase subunit N [Thermomicrobiales bacterium]